MESGKQQPGTTSTPTRSIIYLASRRTMYGDAPHSKRPRFEHPTSWRSPFLSLPQPPNKHSPIPPLTTQQLKASSYCSLYWADRIRDFARTAFSHAALTHGHVLTVFTLFNHSRDSRTRSHSGSFRFPSILTCAVLHPPWV